MLLISSQSKVAPADCQAAHRLKRRPSLVDAEGVLLHSGIEAASAAAFLHENVLHFISDDALEDAATACEYLCDAGKAQLQPVWMQQ